MIWRNLEKNKALFTEAAKSRAFVVFDTETTGLRAEDEVIEFAGYKCVFEKGAFRIFDALHIYIKPSFPVPEKASEINGITNDFLEDKPVEEKAFPIIKKFFGDNPVVGAYNSSFDIKMIGNMYHRQGETFQVGLDVDILKIARDIFCEKKMKDMKLMTVANAYGVDQGIRFHSALDDTRVLLRVINAMIKDLKENGAVGTGSNVEVYDIRFFKGYRGDSRLYANLDVGSVYYSFKDDKWQHAVKGQALSDINMASLESQVFKMAGCSSYQELKDKCKNGEIPESGNR